MTRKSTSGDGSPKRSKIVAGMTISLDGFVNDRNGDLSPLYPDLKALRKTNMLRESIRSTGAAVMGRRTYDVANGDLTGYEYQVPIFVVTHHPPARGPKGTNETLKVHFVTEGPRAAIEKAKQAARGQVVTVVGGVDLIHQLLELGLVDEFHLGIVPVVLGGGMRLFDGLDPGLLNVEQFEVLESPNRTDIRYKVTK